MRASHGSTRNVTLGLASLAVALTYACTDTAVEPRSQNPSTVIDVRGDASGSVWKVIRGELTYVGAATAHFDGRLSGAGFSPKSGSASASALDLSPLEIEELRSRVSRNAISLTAPASAPLVAPGTSAAGKPAVLRRISFKTRFRRGLERDGVRTDWVPNPKGGKRPPVAMLIYKKGLATALIEPSYVQTVTGWQPRRARTTVFDSTGAVSKIILSDFTNLESQLASAGLVDRLAAGALRAAGTFGSLFRPDVLHAATQNDAEDITRCLPQAAALALATAGLAIDLAALDAAITACAASVIACAALPLVYARVARSTAAELAAAALLAACWSADDDCGQEGGNLPETYVAGAHSSSGQTAAASCTDGAGGSYEVCIDYQYEISFDGGVTWNDFVETVCEAAE